MIHTIVNMPIKYSLMFIFLDYLLYHFSDLPNQNRGVHGLDINKAAHHLSERFFDLRRHHNEPMMHNIA